MWSVITTNRFDSWYVELDEEDRNNVAAYLLLLEREGRSYLGLTQIRYMTRS